MKVEINCPQRKAETTGRLHRRARLSNINGLDLHEAGIISEKAVFPVVKLLAINLRSMISNL
jgi:hypothetical protein